MSENAVPAPDRPCNSFMPHTNLPSSTATRPRLSKDAADDDDVPIDSATLRQMFPGFAKYSPDSEIRLRHQIASGVWIPREEPGELDTGSLARKRALAKDCARRQLTLVQAAHAAGKSAIQTIRCRLREHELAIDVLKVQKQQEELRLREAERYIGSVGSAMESQEIDAPMYSFERGASDDGSLPWHLSHEPEPDAGPSRRSTADDDEEYFISEGEGV
ncbi:hypothetical protein EW146_g190 [Bondarzewia mesenterica]|uniref:Uncharacterized protein n=1 Tax=Bondarzewia mesenterica TaxID=1095465 RepID=A0A4S4ME34_9AGAM|nr:hypothetical protein EW146_g190 [Bondarzewia mesenterica]